MRITALEIDGYGVWTGLKVEGLGEGVNVLFGPNEAGKSTLLQFIRSMLYGFSAARRGFLPPLHGGRWGGRLNVAGGHGRFEIARHEDSALAEGAGTQLTLTAADGARHGEHFLKVLLGEMDEATFNNVFAVGLREMQELGTLSAAAVADKLYHLSVGLGRASLVEALRELTASRNRLLDAGGKPAQVVQLLAERERLLGEVRELSGLGRRYARLAADRSQLDGEVRQLEEEELRLAGQLRLTELAVALDERWRQRASLDQQLATLGPAAAVAEGAVERFDSLSARIQHHQQRIGDLQRQRQSLDTEVAGLKVNEGLRRHAARVEALREQEGWLRNLQGQVGGLEKEVAELEVRLGNEHQRLGLARPADAARLPSVAPRTLDALRAPARALRQAAARCHEATEAAAGAELQAETAVAEVTAALKAQGCDDLAAAMDRTGARVAQLRRRVQLDERLDQMARYQVDLEDQSRNLLDRQLLPTWVLSWLGGAFVLGVMLLLIGVFWPGTWTSGLGWFLALLGLAGSCAAALGKITLERSNARQFHNVQRQATVLHGQIRQAKDEREALDKQLARGGGPLASRLQAAESELATLEALGPLEARRGAARDEAAAAVRRRAQAEGELETAKRRWRDALRNAGLPADFAPKQVRGWLRRSEDLGQWQRTLRHRRDELAERRREWESLAGRIGQLAVDAGVAVRGAPAEQLQQLTAALAEQETAVGRRNAARRQLRQLQARQARREEAISRLKHRRRRLLLESGAESEPQFREQAARAAQAAALRHELQTLDREIDAALAGQASREALAEQLRAAQAQHLPQRSEALRQRRAGVAAELRARLERRGQLAEQLAALAADRQLGQKQLDLAAVERRIETAVERWQVLAAAGRFLDDVRRGYERDRQPETLREASQYLQRMTQGRYVRVWTPFGEDVLRVDDAEGRASPIEALSRGTREQLFLSLRLALAAWYGRHGAPLPLVLDDVLVNFDAARAAAAAEVLRDFAADGRQLLVFTCHEHIAAIFASLGAAVSRLPDNSAAQPATVRMHVAAAASRPAAIPSAPATESPPEPPRRRPSRRKRTEPAEGLRIAVEPPAEVVHRPAPVPAPVAAPAPSPPVVAPAPALHWAPIPTPVSAPVSTSPPPAPVPARVVVAAPRPIRRPGAVFDADFFDSAEEAAEEDEDRGFRRRAAAEPQPPADDLDARYAAGEASATAAFWDEPGDLPYDPPDYGNEAEAA